MRCRSACEYTPGSVCCTLSRPVTTPSSISGTTMIEPVSLPVDSARRRRSAGARVQSSTSNGSPHLHDPAEQSRIDALDASGLPHAAPFVDPQVENLLTALHEHEIELIETQQRAGFREDSFAKLVDAPRAVQCAARLEQLGHRAASSLGARGGADAVEAEHEHEHHDREQRKTATVPGVVQQCGEHARRHEDEIRQDVGWLENAAHVAAIERKNSVITPMFTACATMAIAAERPQVCQRDTRQRIVARPQPCTPHPPRAA